MSNTYECSICYCLNHSSRLHCQNCGTIPAQYSISGHVGRILDSIDGFSNGINHGFIETVRALGADSVEKHRAERVNLRTVELTQYAEGE